MLTEQAEDSGVHDVPMLTCDDIRDVLRTEQVLGEVRLPLPLDVEAERTIVANLDAQGTTHEDLAPLDAKHFSVVLLGEAFDLLREQPTRVHTMAELSRRGYGLRAYDELELLDVAPILGRVQLHQLADRVVELWRRRRLVSTARAVESALCGGVLHFDEAVEQLRNVIMEVRG